MGLHISSEILNLISGDISLLMGKYSILDWIENTLFNLVFLTIHLSGAWIRAVLSHSLLLSSHSSSLILVKS